MPGGPAKADTLSLLVLGASYGLLPAVRIALAGHRVSIVCRNAERQVLADHGASLTFLRRDGAPGKRLTMAADHGAASIPARLGLCATDVDPAGFDLVIIAMSEPQCADPEIAALIRRTAEAGRPILSLMNMPPASFMARFGAAWADRLRPAYAAWDCWQAVDPGRITAASPDAQAIRPDPARPQDLLITLGSNFRLAPFADAHDQALLARLVADVEAYRPDGVALPARLVHGGALGVPLSKWPMLAAGNCRALLPDGTPRTIAAAVCDDIDEARMVYGWTEAVIAGIAGADASATIGFSLYARAAQSLRRPSSFARALANGATQVERIDRMIQLAGAAQGMDLPQIDTIVATVDRLLLRNRGA